MILLLNYFLSSTIVKEKNILNSSIIRELCILSEYVVLRIFPLRFYLYNPNSRVISNERQIPYDVTYVCNLKYSTNEPIDQTKTDSQIYITDLWLPTGRGEGREKNWEFEVGRCKLFSIEWISNKVLMYNTGSCIQYLVINHNEKEYENEYIYVYITESLCSTSEINTAL